MELLDFVLQETMQLEKMGQIEQNRKEFLPSKSSRLLINTPSIAGPEWGIVTLLQKMIC